MVTAMRGWNIWKQSAEKAVFSFKNAMENAL